MFIGRENVVVVAEGSITTGDEESAEICGESIIESVEAVLSKNRAKWKKFNNVVCKRSNVNVANLKYTLSSYNRHSASVKKSS